MNKKPLKFLHITKTAGSSIEKVAVRAGVLWGRYDHELRKNLKEDVFGFFWHYPISAFKPELFKAHNFFVVVRDPYERAVSELFWDLEEKWGKGFCRHFSGKGL